MMNVFVQAVVIGSQRLGTADAESDVDIVCYGNLDRDDFFDIFRQGLTRQQLLVNSTSIELVNSLVPILKFTFRQIDFEV
mmetsp:Transcript_13146/g.21884  ORF Transcript_13146/g.21884 Transcript_13146/m.21884 type:complete len:80 (-) Transcript_13146:431-670(-)